MPWRVRFSPTSSFRAGLWLAGISAAVTAASWAWSPLGAYAMHGYFIAYGDWGRAALQLALYQFLHGGLGHWLGNAVFLAVIAPRVEALAGRRAFWGLFVGNALFVAASLYALAQGPTVGISGFCMALAAWYSLEVGRRNPQEAQAGFVLIGINVAMGLFSNVSLVGHAAGAVFGALFWAWGRLAGRR